MAWPIRAAQSLWNLGKKPFAGTGWRGGARGRPEVLPRPAVRPGDPGTRLPPGGRLGPTEGTVVGPRGGRTRVYPPSARTAGARPAVPGSPAVPAGIARRRPVATAAVLGGAGLVGSSLWPDGTPKEQPQPQLPIGLGGVPTGPAQVPDTFQSQLPGLVQRRQKERDSFLDNMQTVMSHSILLSFQNPGRESKYVENAIALLKGDAKSKGSIEDAKIIEEVFKDNKVPKSAKTIYNRLVKHIGPKKAAEVSGYTLEIDKAESKAATDYMKAITDARKAEATGMGTKSYRLQEIIEMSKIPGQFEAAVLALAQEWGAGGTLEIRDIYGGYTGDRKMEEMREKARDLLSGQTGGSVASGGLTESEMVSAPRLKQ